MVGILINRDLISLRYVLNPRRVEMYNHTNNHRYRLQKSQPPNSYPCQGFFGCSISRGPLHSLVGLTLLQVSFSY